MITLGLETRLMQKKITSLQKSVFSTKRVMLVQMPLRMIQIGRTSLTPLWMMWRRRVKRVGNLLRWQWV